MVINCVMQIIVATIHIIYMLELKAPNNKQPNGGSLTDCVNK